MVTIDVWRARIGAHNAGSSGGYIGYITLPCTLLSVAVFHFLVFIALLIIGNVEVNPGPPPSNEYLCNYGNCEATFQSLGEHASHQKLHTHAFNFMFKCGACKQSFSTFASLSSHISKCHKEIRKVDVANVQPPSRPCSYCTCMFQTSACLNRHLIKVHLGNDGVPVCCPLQEDCEREEAFTTKQAFSTHLSRCHPGWQNMKASFVNDHGPQVSDTGPSEPVAPLFQQGYEDGTPDDDSCEEEEYFEAEDICDYKEEDIFAYLASFYLMLEVLCLLPVTTIDRISQSLVFISEVTQHRIRSTVMTELKALDIPEDQIRNILSKVVSCDPLYLSHHKNTRGPDLMTDHLRKKHFKELFPQVPVTYPNLNPKDPIDGDRFASVSVKESLTVLLKDPSVQKEVLQSFKRNTGDNGVYRDYFDGHVCKSRNLPKKRIDLIIFQDGFNVTSMLTSVQDKTRIVGMYMTLGNLKPSQRTKLKAMHLVMLIFEKLVKKYRQKCFSKLVAELKELEVNGVPFMGESIPVFVQFIVGDSLGSHFLGGYVESFTASHFCRYCEISKKELQNDSTAMKPLRTLASYKHSALRAEVHRLTHHHGVKEESAFNKLLKYKVTDPGLPPCLGHDLFHGVVDVDLTSILSSFIRRGWFTHELLNRRIAQFRYAACDSKNKPAPFKKCKGKKKKKNLGGSAVQNWMLLRILPFLIHDKIQDTNDAHWQLYLKLKVICEYVSAPVITSTQVNDLDVLVQEYLEERKILLNAQRPKHHYLRHYASLFHQLGTLIGLWGMRFEQKHQFFKKVARTCNNYINLIFTLATKAQLLFAYESHSARFKEYMSDSKPFDIKPDQFCAAVSSIITAHHFSPNLKATEKINLSGVKYRVGELLVLGKSQTGLAVGWIEAILIDGTEVSFVLRNKTATLNVELGLYSISSPTDHLTLIKHSTLVNPCTQPAYSVGNIDCFSLKHSIP